MTADYPLTGPEAIEHALSRIDLDELEAEQRQVITSKKKTARPRAVRLLGIIAGLRKNQVGAGELMLKSVPVIPPKFRPFSVTGDTFLPGDANEMYRDLLEYRRLYQKTEESLGREGSGEVYGDLVRAVRATYGFGDSPNPKTHARGVKGFFQTVTGTSPKTGFFQSKMLSKPVDTVARGVIIPDADYDMNEIGLPAEHAWKLYGSYIQRRLVRSGLAPAAALRHVKERTPQALKALESEMTVRPVVATRSPAWHKFNVIGANPRIVEGDAIRINTWVTDGLTADFNGDEQIGKILVLCDVGSDYHTPLLDLQCRVSGSMIEAMHRQQMIPAFDLVAHDLFLVEMEDFPRLQKVGSNPNGKNGVIDFFALPPGLQVVAYDEATGCPRWAPASLFSVHYQREIEIVNLSNGRQIVTDDDPRAVYGIDPSKPGFLPGRFAPTDAAERRVVVPCVKDVAASCVGLGALDVVEIGGRNFALDYDLGYLFGALCGDGWWDKKFYRGGAQKRCYLADLKGFTAAAVTRILRGYFFDLTCERREFKAELETGRYGDTVRYTYSSSVVSFTHFVEFCAKWMGGVGDEFTSGSGNKRIPDFFLIAPETFRRGLLSGLFDTDGSCSVSEAKGKPYLSCSFTSTSLRLASDVKFLCLTLGVRASVSFSKETTRGNNSWICSVSLPDAKREDLFSRLVSPWKREAFVNTPVAVDNTSQVYDKVVVPDTVWERIHPDMVSPKVTRAMRDAGGPDLKFKKLQQALSVRWYETRDSKILSRSTARRILMHLRSEAVKADELVAKAIADLRRDADEVDRERMDLWVSALRAACAPGDVPSQKSQQSKAWVSARQTFAAGFAGPKRRASFLAALEAPRGFVRACDAPLVLEWERCIVENETIAWSVVESVDYTGQREDGYDLTVPGYETFMSADGVILSNTMSIHLPSSDAAVKDVRERMMPDKMLWSVKDRDKVVPVPKHETQIGLNLGGSLPSAKSHVFLDDEEAMAAINAGQVALSDDITIDPHKPPVAHGIAPTQLTEADQAQPVSSAKFGQV